MHQGSKDAVITREICIRDDEVRKLRGKLCEIRDLLEYDSKVFEGTAIGNRIRKVYSICDGELWPG